MHTVLSVTEVMMHRSGSGTYSSDRAPYAHRTTASVSLLQPPAATIPPLVLCGYDCFRYFIEVEPWYTCPFVNWLIFLSIMPSRFIHVVIQSRGFLPFKGLSIISLYICVYMYVWVCVCVYIYSSPLTLHLLMDVQVIFASWRWIMLQLTCVI